MSPGIASRSPAAYELLMLARYGRHYGDRMQAVAAEVPPGASVVEVCCGPGTLYNRHLRDRVSSYVGLDANERFVAGLRRSGIEARTIDLSSSRDPLPSGDVVIIQSSLYQFMPDPTHVIDRMLAAARRLVIVSEPVSGLTWRANPLSKLIGRMAQRAGGTALEQFSDTVLDEMFEPYRRLMLKELPIAGGREKLFVLQAG